MSAVLRAGIFGALVCCLPPSAHAQHDGALDREFRAGAGASDDVLTAAALPQGAKLLGGYFTTFDGHERWRLARLRADGELDAGFDPGESSGAAAVSQVAAGPNGAAFVAGSFARFGGLRRPLVARLKADGAVDTGFDATPAFAGVAGRVNALAMLPGGKLLVGGRFDPSAGQRHLAGALVVRLLETGRLDETFACELIPSTREDQISAMAVLPDGKLLVGTREGITRLEANGARDAGFETAKDAGEVSALAVQGDGRIVVAVRRVAGWRMARLGADGKADPSFRAVEGTGEEAGSVAVLAQQADGKILAGGSFREVEGVHRHGLARLNGDGTLDRTFDPGTGVEVIPFEEADETPEAIVRVLSPLTEGGLLVAGRFDLYNGMPCHNVARLFNGVTATPTVTPPGK